VGPSARGISRCTPVLALTTVTKESEIAQHGPEVDATAYKSDYSVVGKQAPRHQHSHRHTHGAKSPNAESIQLTPAPCIFPRNSSNQPASGVFFLFTGNLLDTQQMASDQQKPRRNWHIQLPFPLTATTRIPPWWWPENQPCRRDSDPSFNSSQVYRAVLPPSTLQQAAL
jgi:hypothetical protein